MEYLIIESFLHTYGQSGLKALKLVLKYLNWRLRKYGRNSNCVTYESLRKYMTYRKINVKFTTVERALRKLSEGCNSPIKRLRRGKEVIFCVNEDNPLIEFLKRGDEEERDASVL